MEQVLRKMLTASEVARRLGLSVARVQQLRAQGRLPGLSTPLGYLYKEADVLKLERQRERGKVERGEIAPEQLPGDHHESED